MAFRLVNVHTMKIVKSNALSGFASNLLHNIKSKNYTDIMKILITVIHAQCYSITSNIHFMYSYIEHSPQIADGGMTCREENIQHEVRHELIKNILREMSL